MYHVLDVIDKDIIPDQGWRQEFSDTGAEFPDAGATTPNPTPRFFGNLVFSREANFVCSNSIYFLLVPVEVLVRQKKKSLCAKIIA